MKNKHHFILALIGILTLLCPVCSFAQDWPQWRGPDRDGKVEKFTHPQTWPAELNQLWKLEVGLGDSTPALVGNKLYVFTRENLYEIVTCVDADSGEEIWRYDYRVTTLSGPAAWEHPGPRSSPAVADGKVVNVGVSGILTCIDITDGKLLWRKETFPNKWPRYYAASSPLLVDSMVIAQLGGNDEGGTLAFDSNSGKEIWRWTGDAPAYSSPMLMTIEDNRQIVQMTAGNITGVSLADGKLLWKIPFEPRRIRVLNAATPIVNGQKVIYAGIGRGTNAVSIEKQEDNFAVNELWTNEKLNPLYASAVLKDGYIYGMSERGKMYCIDAKTGKTAWEDIESLDIYGFGAIIDAGPHLMVLTSDAELIIFKPNKKKFDEVKRYEVSDTSTYAHPVVSGNRLFIKDAESLSLWVFE